MISQKFYNPLLIIFYFFFLICWFKDNLPPLRDLNIHRHYFLLIFFLLLLPKLSLFLKRRAHLLALLRSKRPILLSLFFLGLLLFISRLPWLLNFRGLGTSDDAIVALMAKHIAEGKTPPICFYGQLYIGSLPSHVTALFFRLFGFSPLLFVLITLSFYFSFLAINFLLLHRLFSFPFSFMISVFYCLPIGALREVSFDNSLVAPFWLFLGTSLIFLAYLIAFEGKNQLIAFLGYLMGLSFWTHPISVYFILTALLILIAKSKLDFKKYLKGGIYFFMGFFPMIIQEIYHQFHLIKFLMAGEKTLSLYKIVRTLDLIFGLFLPPQLIFLAISLILVLFGTIIFIKIAAEKKSLFPKEVIHLLFLSVFFLIYLFSGHSSRYLSRYLYPLIFGLPPLFFSPIILLKKSKKAALLVGIIVMAFFFTANLSRERTWLRKIKNDHGHRTQLIAALKKTGKKYWTADYWLAYLTTFLTGEEIIVDAWPFNRYYPYRLDKYNNETKENFIFSLSDSSQLLQYQSLLKVVESLGLNYGQKEINGYGLIYDLEGTLYPQIYYGPAPEAIPELSLLEMIETEDDIILNFINKRRGENLVFKLVVKLDDLIQGWRYFSLADEKVVIKLPKPEKNNFLIHYYLEYLGLKINSSSKSYRFSPTLVSNEKNRSEIIWLKGVGPVIDWEKKKSRLLEKEVKFLLKKKPKETEGLKIYLFSPFEFSHLHWYGRFSQQVDVYLNETRIFSQKLKDGSNVITLSPEYLKDLNGKTVIKMTFKYHLAFSFAPFWRIAALLEKID